MIDQAGPHVGAARLSDWNRDMPRREVASILARVRELVRRKGKTTWRLEWRPGDVWAIDHAQSPRTLENGSRSIVALRDLGSGETLSWESVQNQGAEETERHLREQLRDRVPPLVVKMDNGPGLRAKTVETMLQAKGVAVLKSPPRTPRYNGAIEAGIGWLKRRTRHRAQRRCGDPADWKSEDLRAAREEANQEAKTERSQERGGGRRGGCELQSRELRRERLRIASERKHADLVAAAAVLQEQPLSKKMEERLRRKALEQALIECGSLEVKRRVIHPRIETKRSAIIP